jgi:hypothetical protein
MNAGPENEQQVPPLNSAPLSSLEFCDALAAHLKAAYPAKITPDTWYAVLGRHAPDPSTLSASEISRFFLTPNVAAQARFSALLEYPPSKWLLEQEMQARGLWPPPATESAGPPDVYRVAFESNLKGICFSGGGIRSATFNLGILQALAGRRKLGSLDYLSSVSGGGYIHHFFSSWIACENLPKVEEQLCPLPEDSKRTQWPDPIRWLRRYSNYLTPQKGLLTIDTWAAVSVWLRNTFLNQIILLSSLLFVLLLPHAPLLACFDATSQTTNPATGGFWPAALIVLLFAIAAFDMLKGLHRSSRVGARKRVGFGERDALLLIILPVFLALFVLSPFVYRSTFQGLVAKPAASAQPQPVGIQVLVQSLHSLAPRPAASAVSGASNAQKPNNPGVLANIAYWLHNDQLPLWTPWQENLQFLLIAFLLGQSLLVIAFSGAIPNWTNRPIPALAAIVIAAGTSLALLHVVRLLLLLAAFAVSYDTLLRIAIVFVPLLLLTVLFISMDLAIGTFGERMEDSAREWIARVRGVSFVAAFVWLAVTGSSLLGPILVTHLFQLHSAWFSAAVTGWAGTTVSSILAGKSRTTSGSTDAPTQSSSAVSFLIMIGPAVFVVGLMLGLSWVLQTCVDAFHLYQLEPFLVSAAILLAIALFFSWRVDVNDFSLHAFYRDRIARCYAGASNPDRRPDAFTGFAPSDSRLRVADLLPVKFGCGNPALWVNPPAPPSYQGPFPIFCTTLNLSFGEDLAYQERKAAAFAFTPLFCGYDVGWTEGESAEVQFNGYVPTNTFAYPKSGGPHVSTAVAASGAALNPNDGYHSSPAMAFLMTLFNVRLGWWIPNPRNLRTSLLGRISGPTPVLGLPYLLRELFGSVSDDAPFVNLSDGGHFENMGLYELVRRRCRTIIICDSEADGDFVFEGLGMAIRKCRIDFGAEISLDLDELIPGTDGLSKFAYSMGTITYPALSNTGVPNEKPAQGKVLYLKSTITGREPADILNYKRENDAFPSDSTLNQWFTESQFESYRRLGQFIGEDPKVIDWFENYL